ncbi:MAG: HNH endonuclease [Chloroflexi bacterium]|nr:HNH endonuclease [Chloroflexota bacterium]
MAAASGYCTAHENEIGSELEADHYQPAAHGGTDSQSNLVYACPTCNRLKSDYWKADDSSRRILHPRRDPMEEHLVELPNGRLQSLSTVGGFHIGRLRLNRPQLVDLRLARQRSTQDAAHIAELELALEEARRQVALLEGRLDDLLDLIRRLTWQGE